MRWRDWLYNIVTVRQNLRLYFQSAAAAESDQGSHSRRAVTSADDGTTAFSLNLFGWCRLLWVSRQISHHQNYMMFKGGGHHLTDTISCRWMSAGENSMLLHSVYCILTTSLAIILSLPVWGHCYIYSHVYFDIRIMCSNPKCVFKMAAVSVHLWMSMDLNACVCFHVCLCRFGLVLFHLMCMFTKSVTPKKRLWTVSQPSQVEHEVNAECVQSNMLQNKTGAGRGWEMEGEGERVRSFINSRKGPKHSKKLSNQDCLSAGFEGQIYSETALHKCAFADMDVNSEVKASIHNNHFSFSQAYM